MTRSAHQMLVDAGGAEFPRWAIQTAKIHEDLAYRFSAPLANWAILTLATADGKLTTEHFEGPHAYRKARGRINRLKRGEEALA